MVVDSPKNIPLQELKDALITPSGVRVFILRLDLIHPTINGNKYFKLKYNLDEMDRLGQNTLLTFGGAYSNHIAATASAGKEKKINTIGIIRGEELKSTSNRMLKTAADNGMDLHFVTREEYRKRYREEYHVYLKSKFGDFYLLPEGGSNRAAVKGCAEILKTLDNDFDFVCLPVGTGATMAGIAASASKKQQVIGFAVLANANYLDEDVSKMVMEFSGKELPNTKIIHDFHFGRYARSTGELDKFIKRFTSDNNIPIEPVYTGKMLFGIYDMIKGGYFVRGEKILVIHTGGLQANVVGEIYK